MPTLETPYGNFDISIEQSPVDNRDYIAETIYGDSDLPKEYSCVSDLMPVRNQKSQGTCAAQTASCMKEWQEKKDINFSDYMSPQFIYNNRTNVGSSGMNSRDVMKILNKIGICPEYAYPYNTFDEISPELLKDASNYVIDEYAQVKTIEGLKKALYVNGPCYIAVPVYNYNGRMWKPKSGEQLLGGHALTVVGWTKEGFIIRNSWGDRWNGNGYTNFPWEDWGLQWEVWTTIDANSRKPIKPVEPKKSNRNWLIRCINWIFGLLEKLTI